MSRVQLSINVTDLDAAVAFYTRMLGVAPASPGNGPGGTINYLGAEVGTAREVASADERLAAAGLDVNARPGTECCYARQDKVWARDRDGVPWQYYTVLEHIEVP